MVSKALFPGRTVFGASGEAPGFAGFSLLSNQQKTGPWVGGFPGNPPTPLPGGFGLAGGLRGVSQGTQSD